MNLYDKRILSAILLFAFLPFAVSPKSRFFKNILNKALSRPSIAPNIRSEVINLKNIYVENFHVVEVKRLYRSAQLTPNALEGYIKKHGIKTVVNLRGKDESAFWWTSERDVCQKHNVEFFNIAMSAQMLTSRQNLIELLEIYDTAPLPILIHCFGGADRTGEAAALWVLEKQNKSYKKAVQQLSPFYRHFNSQYPAKDFLIKIWGGREWLETRYNPRDYPGYV